MRIAAYVVACLAVAGLAVGAAYYLRAAARTTLPEPAEKPVLVAALPVESGTVREEVTRVGNVEPLTLVAVRSKVSGRIDMLGADENDIVEAGKTVLAEIDRETYHAQLEQAQAVVKAAGAANAVAAANLENARTEYRRAEKLFTEGAISEQLRDQAKARHAAAIAQKHAAEAQQAQAAAALKLATIQYRESQVIAPINGVVLKKYQDAGNMTAPTAPEPLFTIGEIRRVKVSAGLSERYVGRIRQGKTVARIVSDAYPGDTCTATLSAISPIVDPATRTVRIEAVIPNADLKLKPGMFVRLHLVLEEHKGVPVVPADAILRDARGSYVYVLLDNRARRREVRPGLRQGERREVAAGVEPGELIVVKGQTNLKDGDAVRLVQAGGKE